MYSKVLLTIPEAAAAALGDGMREPNKGLRLSEIHGGLRQRNAAISGRMMFQM
jgi:hypothetical protein